MRSGSRTLAAALLLVAVGFGGLILRDAHVRIESARAMETARAREAVIDASLGTEAYLDSTRARLRRFVHERDTELRALWERPWDGVLYGALSKSLREYLPSASHLTLADNVGEPWLEDPVEGIDEACRDTLAHYARTGSAPALRLHGTDNAQVTGFDLTDVLHFDLVVALDAPRDADLKTEEAFLVLVQVRASALTRSFESWRPEQHQLLLLQQESTPGTEAPRWRAFDADALPTPLEAVEVLASRAVPGTAWRIADALPAEVWLQRQIRAVGHTAALGGLGLLAMVLLGLWLRQMARDRAAVVRTLAEVRDSMEREVEERTKALRRTEDLLVFQSRHDMLTGLPNRRAMMERVEAMIDRVGGKSEKAALLLLDLDQFKLINDTWGHDVGDALIRRVAVLLKTRVGAEGFVARMGPDQFGVLIGGVGAEAARKQADALCREIRTMEFRHRDRILWITASVGIVDLCTHGRSAQQALRCADLACHTAKGRRPGSVCVYSGTDLATARRSSDMQWATRVAHALVEKRIRFHCQPIVPICAQEEAPRYECLVRMLDRKGKVIPAGAFVSAVECFGNPMDLDLEIVRQVCQWVALPGNEVRVNINLSGATLSEEEALRRVMHLVEDSRVDPRRLCFEITETAAVSQPAHARRFMDRLRALGCEFALDDFGTGLSSFGYLREFETEYVKIDGAFVRNIHKSHLCRVLVSAIHDIAKALGRRTVVEFVESEEELAVLREIGIDYGQGYLFGAPVSVSDLTNLPHSATVSPSAQQIA